MKSWIWDQYLPENMQWNSGNMRSLELWDFETLKPINFETKTPRSQKSRNLKPKTKKPRKPLPHPSTYRLPPHAPDHPLGGHERTWGTRVVGTKCFCFSKPLPNYILWFPRNLCITDQISQIYSDRVESIFK